MINHGDDDAFDIIHVAHCSLNVLLHTAGIYLLVTVPTYVHSGCTQKTIILHMSVNELICNLVSVAHVVVKWIWKDEIHDDLREQIKAYTVVFKLVFLYTCYLLIMIGMTVDRYLHTYLNIRYRVFISLKKVQYCCYAIWLVSAVAFVITITITAVNPGTNYIKIVFYKFIFLPTEIASLLIALATYAYIFRKHKLSMMKTQDSKQRRRNTAWQIFRQSNFWLVTLIIGSYILFVLIPDSVYLIENIVRNRPKTRFRYIRLCLHIGNTCDAIIYIFLIPNIRKFLSKKFGAMCGRDERNDASPVLQSIPMNTLSIDKLQV